MNSVLRFSVVMPLYNKAPYVVEAIESILCQSCPAEEIIVVDDGSTDGGPELVRRIGDRRIHLATQANAGVSAARNYGIEIANGNYIAFLDADDRYRPGFLGRIAELARQYPEAGMLCTGYACVWEDGRTEERGLLGAVPNQALLINDFYRAWSRGAFSCTNAIVIARPVFGDEGLRFPLGEKLGEDQDLWFRIAERTTVAYANVALSDYRMGVHGSATHGEAIQSVLPCYQRLGERLARKEVPVNLRAGGRRLLASHLLNVARANLRAGDRRNAAKMLCDKRALGNPAFFLRTLLAVAFTPASIPR
jgi:glycosyltransferase involved in cell wall biosynthesis